MLRQIGSAGKAALSGDLRRVSLKELARPEGLAVYLLVGVGVDVDNAGSYGKTCRVDDLCRLISPLGEYDPSVLRAHVAPDRIRSRPVVYAAVFYK